LINRSTISSNFLLRFSVALWVNVCVTTKRRWQAVGWHTMDASSLCTSCQPRQSVCMWRMGLTMRSCCKVI